MNICMAQINTFVGDYDGNVRRVLEVTHRAKAQLNADLIVFPELTLTGYPPEDLLMRSDISERTESAISVLLKALPQDVTVIVGYPRKRKDKLFNSAGVIQCGRLVAEYDKQCLPNYQVFDEKRYFESGRASCVVDIGGISFGLSICEDIWNAEPALKAQKAGAQCLLNLNASPFHKGKLRERIAVVSARAKALCLPIVYVNQIGGQDELVFDGGSFAVDGSGELRVCAPQFVEATAVVSCHTDDVDVVFNSGNIATQMEDLHSIWRALELGLQDYVAKNGFPGVVLGLSGGIDSAVTLAIAVDALGADRVEAVMMPFRYTSHISIEDAHTQSKVLGVKFTNLSIEPAYEAFMKVLGPEFRGFEPNITEENLQARCRAVLLMSLSNKKNLLVLTTGNKSELAVGYSTLYGDMAGGFDVLKDCPKTLVYELARYRNSLGLCIPERVMTRPPSAELAPNQKDADSLPSYDVLDLIVEQYIENDVTKASLIEFGFDANDVQKITRLIDLNEYKRRQAPVGVRISRRAFGRDRRYPITWSWQNTS